MDLEGEINNSNAINNLIDQYSSSKYLYSNPQYSIEFCKMIKQLYQVYTYKATNMIEDLDGIVFVLFNFIKNEINEERNNSMDNDVICNSLSTLTVLAKYGMIYIYLQ